MAVEWPAWELQGYGSAAPAPEHAAAGDPDVLLGLEAPPPRLDPLGPWFSARLTFASGARIDVLVTVSDDGLTVEDMRADPPLTLDGMATLARWIDGPLDEACRLATGRPRKGRPTLDLHPEPESAQGADRDAAGDEVIAARRAEDAEAAPVDAVVRGDGVLCGPGSGPGDDDRTAVAGIAAPVAAVYNRHPKPSGSTEPGAPTAAAVAPPAVLTRSRTTERRKLAADAYRAAQRDGRDPVLAVMNATGRNRRRALRLIAGARDEGFLTPRHNKR
ncbi:DUF6214 family protein [Streptomyces sp. NPDC053427]|uniref:DUF6214 family protein n=1 Tax=Streptomyces sp. NPDC053427 TaxID=3365701 RepID=UPI0037D0DEFF